jgi:histidyl-tRNA synthetase
VCGGGRYDGLIGELGGASTPSVGFGLGIERLLALLEEHGRLPAPPPGPALYAVAAGDAARDAARAVVRQLRGEGLAAEADLSRRSIKAQMKAAGRLRARYVTVLAENEMASGTARLKRMHDGAETELPLAGLAAAVKRLDAQAAGSGDLGELLARLGPAHPPDGSGE